MAEGRRTRNLPSGCAGSGDLYNELLDLRAPSVEHSYRQRNSGDHALREFFPRDEVQDLLKSTNEKGNKWLYECLHCSCEICKPLLALSNDNSSTTKTRHIEEMSQANAAQNDYRIPLLATLIYLGRSGLFLYLISKNSALAENRLRGLGNEPEKVKKLKNILSPWEKKKKYDPAKCLEVLCADFSVCKYMFDLPTFPSDYAMEVFDPERPLPYLSQSPPSNSPKGLNGKIWQFEIHPEYVDQKFKDEWFSGGKSKLLVRKAVRIPRLTSEDISTDSSAREGDQDEDEKSRENDNLLFVRNMKKNSEKNLAIIDLHEWYYQGDFMNLVFPYYPFTLLEVLREDDALERLRKSGIKVPGLGDTEESLREHWLWKEMLNVMSALKSIHNPGDITDYTQGGKPKLTKDYIGFHFDIKPSNIVIDDTGRLLISDFGTVQFTRSQSGESNDLNAAVSHARGDNNYKPPEMAQRIRGPLGDHTRKYDVWSIACVMSEVIAYIKGYRATEHLVYRYYSPGPEAVRQFASARYADSKNQGLAVVGSSWYLKSGTGIQAQLKPSVSDWLNVKDKTNTKVQQNPKEPWFEDPLMFQGNAQDSYLSQVISLLESMFSLSQVQRLSSSQVVKKLNLFSVEFQAAKRNRSHSQRTSHDILISDLEDEFGNAAVDQSFRFSKSGAGYLFSNRPEVTTARPIEQFIILDDTRNDDARLVIATSKIDEVSQGIDLPVTQLRSVSIESASKKEEEFFPRYLFQDRDEDWWSFSFKFISPYRIYRFPNSRDDDATNFFLLQGRILGQKLVACSHFEIKKLVMDREEYEFHPDRLASMQVWIDLARQKLKDQEEQNKAKVDQNLGPNLTNGAAENNLNVYRYQPRLVLYLPPPLSRIKGKDRLPVDFNTMIVIRHQQTVEICDGLFDDREKPRADPNAMHIYRAPVVTPDELNKPHKQKANPDRQPSFEVKIFSANTPSIPSIPVTPKALEKKELAPKKADTKRLIFLDITFAPEDRK